MKSKQQYCQRGHDRTLPGAIDKSNRSCVQCVKIRRKSEKYLFQRREYYKTALKGKKHNERVQNWNSKNRTKRKAHRLKCLYGIKLEDVPDKCQVCFAQETIHVDHNHKTGIVRGFLCGGCNRALGILKENPIRIRQLADYIEERNKEYVI